MRLAGKEGDTGRVPVWWKLSCMMLYRYEDYRVVWAAWDGRGGRSRDQCSGP